MSACGEPSGLSSSEPCAALATALPSSRSLHGQFVFFRLLLQLTQSQQTSFALERNLRTQQEVEDKVKGFGFREDTLQLITEVSDALGFV